MTPLAVELLEDLYSPDGIHIRRGPWGSDKKALRKTCHFLRTLLQQVKFFEMTAVWPLIGQLSRDMFESYEYYDRVDQRRAFLPAPMTWIETQFPSLRGMVEDRNELINAAVSLSPEDIKRVTNYYRAAFVFVGSDSTHIAERYQIQYETPRVEPGPRIWRVVKFDQALPLVNSGLKPQRAYVYRGPDGGERRYDKPVASLADFVHYAMLALINSPRIIGQRSRFPFGRVEREALKRAKLVGKFPLRAWTEILLLVMTQPEDRRGEPTKESHLTGDRCLHYCRTFLRIRLGMLEYVEGHWRGNPAIGIKQSRYRVKPELVAGRKQ